MRRLLDPLLYTLAALALIYSLADRLLGDGPADRRPRPALEPPAPQEPTRGPYARRRPWIEPGPLPPADTWDPLITVETDSPPTNSVGSAFVVADGIWLTARHVVEGCKRVGLVEDDRRARLVKSVAMHPGADVALIRARRGGPALSLGNAENLSRGAEGYAVGYPSGKPGEASGLLIGRGRKREKGPFRRFATIEPVLIWAENHRRPADLDGLGGLSGGPMMNADGEVVGIMEAASQRRGRIVTSAPATASELLEQTRSRAYGRGERPRLDLPGLQAAADRLRRQRSVALVVCRID